MTTDPIAAARALIEPLTRYGDQKARGASSPQNRLCADAAAAIATLADALEAERAKNQRLREALDPDSLAQIIRVVDGGNRLGAGALSEKISAALRSPEASHD